MLGGKQFVPHRVVDYCCNKGSILLRRKARRPLLKPHRNAKLREPMRKIGSPIQRIDIPAKLPLNFFARALFTKHAVVGKHF